MKEKRSIRDLYGYLETNVKVAVDSFGILVLLNIFGASVSFDTTAGKVIVILEAILAFVFGTFFSSCLRLNKEIKELEKAR